MKPAGSWNKLSAGLTFSWRFVKSTVLTTPDPVVTTVRMGMLWDSIQISVVVVTVPMVDGLDAPCRTTRVPVAV